MQLPIETPPFITELMQQWLLQYKQNELKELTRLGLFHWRFFPDKRNPKKPRRIPTIGDFVDLIDSGFSRSVFFLQIDAITLHVFESSGMALGGYRIAHEYILEENTFVETQILMKMIS